MIKRQLHNHPGPSRRVRAGGVTPPPPEGPPCALPAAALPGASAKPFADTGHTRHPFGVIIEAGGRASKWQVALMSAPGETWGPETDGPAPVLGEEPPTMEVPALTNDVATVELALVAQLLATDPGEIASVGLYSARPTPPAVGHGATIVFHDGSRAFINHVR